MLNSLPTFLNSPAPGPADTPGAAMSRVAGEAGTGFAALMQQQTDLRLAAQHQFDRRLADRLATPAPRPPEAARRDTAAPHTQPTPATQPSPATPPTPPTQPTQRVPEAAAGSAAQAARQSTAAADTGRRSVRRDEDSSTAGRTTGADGSAAGTADGLPQSPDLPPGKRRADAAALARSRALQHGRANGFDAAALPATAAAAHADAANLADDPQATDPAAPGTGGSAVDPGTAAGPLPAWLHAQTLMAGWPGGTATEGSSAEPASDNATLAADGRSPLQRQAGGMPDRAAAAAAGARRAAPGLRQIHNAGQAAPDGPINPVDSLAGTAGSGQRDGSVGGTGRPGLRTTPLGAGANLLAEPGSGQADAAGTASAVEAAAGQARLAAAAGELGEPAASAALAAANARAAQAGASAAAAAGLATPAESDLAQPGALPAAATADGRAIHPAQPGDGPAAQRGAANRQEDAGATLAGGRLGVTGWATAAGGDSPAAHAVGGQPPPGPVTGKVDTAPSAAASQAPAGMAARTAAPSTARSAAEAALASQAMVGTPAGRNAQRAAGLERPTPGGVVPVTGRAAESPSASTATADANQASATPADEPRSAQAGTGPDAGSAQADATTTSLAGTPAAGAGRADATAPVDQPSLPGPLPPDRAQAGLPAASAGLAAAGAHSTQREGRLSPASADSLRVADGGPAAVALPAPASGSAPNAAAAGSQAPAPATPVTEARIPVPLDSTAFAPALGAQISLFARDGVQTARLELNPAEMGPITVQIAVAGNAARVDFQADFAATRNIIEASLPALAGALQDAGLTLTGGGVFQQPPGSQAQPEQPRGGHTPARADHPPGGADDRQAVIAVPARSRGLVDLVA